MTRRPRDRTAGDTLTSLIFTLWRWRTELALTLILTLAIHQLAKLTGPTTATILAAAATATALAIPGSRQRLHTILHTARVRRAWTRAAHRGGATDPHPRRSHRPDPILGPRITKVTPVPAGDLCHIRTGRGSSIQRLEACQPDIENELRAPIEITRNPQDPSRATVLIRRRDPFEHTSSLPWPPLRDGLDNLSVWDPITVGIDEEGHPVRLRLVGGHILVGGITGGGKSVAIRPLLATAALSKDPCALWLFDAKVMEFAPWAPAAQEFVGRDGKRTLEVLAYLRSVADERQREIVATGGDKLRRSDKLPVHVVVVDELANYAELDEGKRIMAALRDLASRGRALGITVICATQVPHSDIIDTTLRNQFSTRIAFRCADRHHAGTILGQSDAVAAAAEISDRLPGVGYALGETGRYVRFRSVFVGRPDDDQPDRADDVLTVVRRAAGRRIELGLAGLPPAGVATPSSRSEDGGVGNPPGKPGGNGDGTLARASLGDVMASVEEHLSDRALSQAEVCRRLGRSKADGTVRRALAALAEAGRASRTGEGWVRAGGAGDA